MSKKKSNTSKKSRKAKYRQSKKTDGVLKRPKEKKKFMDMTPESQEGNFLLMSVESNCCWQNLWCFS